MDFHTYTTTREACSKAGLDDAPDAFYERAVTDALAIFTRVQRNCGSLLLVGHLASARPAGWELPTKD